MVFLVVLFSIQILFGSLDLIDHYLTRHDRHNGQPVSLETVLFLVGTIGLYALIQFGGLSLVPNIDELLLTAGAYASFLVGRPLEVQPIQGGWLFIICVSLFYLAGLWDYVVHRFMSHSRLFWFTHEYHHLPKQVFLGMPGLAARPFVVFSSFPATAATVASAYGLLIIAGLPLWDLAPVKILIFADVLLGATTHSSFLRRFWWIHRLFRWTAITTPQEHVLHHTVDLQGNYGNFTVLWDHVFGTYLDPTRGEYQNRQLGLKYDQDFLGVITLSYLKLPKAIRQRFQLHRYCNIETVDQAD
ncbi:MAG: sterol desaturase family protein [Chloroflexota bacterium]